MVLATDPMQRAVSAPLNHVSAKEGAAEDTGTTVAKGSIDQASRIRSLALFRCWYNFSWKSSFKIALYHTY